MKINQMKEYPMTNKEMERENILDLIELCERKMGWIEEDMKKCIQKFNEKWIEFQNIRKENIDLLQRLLDETCECE